MTSFVTHCGPGTGERLRRFAVVTFTAEDGRKFEFEASSGGNPPPHRQGETERVRYSLDDPQFADVSAFMPCWIAPILFGVPGAMFGFGGVAARIDLVRRRRSARSGNNREATALRA